MAQGVLVRYQAMVAYGRQVVQQRVTFSVWASMVDTSVAYSRGKVYEELSEGGTLERHMQEQLVGGISMPGRTAVVAVQSPSQERRSPYGVIVGIEASGVPTLACIMHPDGLLRQRVDTAKISTAAGLGDQGMDPLLHDVDQLFAFPPRVPATNHRDCDGLAARGAAVPCVGAARHPRVLEGHRAHAAALSDDGCRRRAARPVGCVRTCGTASRFHR